LRIDASALTRVASWIRAIRIFSDHPVLGIGFNTYAFVQESYGYVRLGNGTYSVDGGLLFIALMTGLVGVSVYIAMLVIVVRRCRHVWRSADAPLEFRALATGIAAGTVALCVHSVFVNSLLTSFVMEPLFVLWGLSFGLARSLEGAGSSRDDPSLSTAGALT
jgi:O-antigen ligase